MKALLGTMVLSDRAFQWGLMEHLLTYKRYIVIGMIAFIIATTI